MDSEPISTQNPYYQALYNVAGKVIIITGGAGLLGSQFTEALASAGAYPVVADIDGGMAGTVASGLQDFFPSSKALPVQVDIADKPSVENMVSHVLDTFGRIDGLVNNAAINPKFEKNEGKRHSSSFEEFPLDAWNLSLQVDLTGTFLCTQAVGRVMVELQSGSIVNISSTYGNVGPDQRLYEKEGTTERSFKPVSYSVTKGAILNFTRYLATYWGKAGIRVNTLTLGGVFNGHDDEFVEKYSWRTPLGRMARKDEYCGALLFLLSGASSYMTGSNMIVDGGWTAW
jgi:NAD(P)-dependent dehydrogenase (short-subunit alcohol dehydrogenase family)